MKKPSLRKMYGFTFGELSWKPLKPLTIEVNNNGHCFIVKGCAGKRWVLAFMWLILWHVTQTWLHEKQTNPLMAALQNTVNRQTMNTVQWMSLTWRPDTSSPNPVKHSWDAMKTDASAPAQKTQMNHCQCPSARDNRTPSDIPCPCPEWSGLF